MNKNEAFFEAGEKDISLALDILKIYQNEYKKSTDCLEYDNYVNNSGFDINFLESMKLERFYKPLLFNNNLETFVGMLLDHSLNYATKVSKLDVLDYLLENRHKFNIKDETIVQFFVEKNYELDASHQSFGVKLEEFQENLVNVVDRLIKKGISFKSDTKGYLPQIIAFNNLPNEAELLVRISDSGSNITNLIKRFENSDNWLSAKEEVNLDEHDFNNDREYNIYKKFDSRNTISNKAIKLCKTISAYTLLNDKVTDIRITKPPKKI